MLLAYIAVLLNQVKKIKNSDNIKEQKYKILKRKRQNLLVS